VYANARYFASNSSKVPVDVSAGEAAAGMGIDFYGRCQAGAVADAQGNSRVGYVDPVGATATTADPVSILRGAPSPDLADAFVAWCLSVEAQRLWQYRKQVAGGTERFELRRQPIRQDLFTEAERAFFTDPQIDPFGDATPMPKGVPSYFSLVTPLTQAIAIDTHDELQSAWAAIQKAGPEHPNYAEMLRLFDAMPDALTLTWPDETLRANWLAILNQPDHPRQQEVAGLLNAARKAVTDAWKQDPDQKLRDRLQWGAFFAKNYQQIVALAQQ